MASEDKGSRNLMQNAEEEDEPSSKNKSLEVVDNKKSYSWLEKAGLKDNTFNNQQFLHEVLIMAAQADIQHKIKRGPAQQTGPEVQAV